MKTIIQTILDSVAILGSCLLATWIRFDSGLIPIIHAPPPPRQLYINGAVVGTVIVILVLHAMKTYDDRRIGRLIRSSLLGAVVILVVAFMIHTEPPYSRIVLLLSAALIPFGLVIERFVLAGLLKPSESEKK